MRNNGAETTLTGIKLASIKVGFIMRVSPDL
jgi:hypothetical protein